MVAPWRAVGMRTTQLSDFVLYIHSNFVNARMSPSRNYIQYSAICARLVRRALKPEFQAAAMKTEVTNARVIKWENGKPIGITKK